MRILIIGCGNMVGSMLEKWLENDLVTHADVVNPSPLSKKHADKKLSTHERVLHFPDKDTYLASSPNPPEAIVLGIKPQMLEDVLIDWALNIPAESVVVSVLAGKKLPHYEAILGTEQPIIRTMPNTASQVGAGFTAIAPNENVSDNQLQIVSNLLSANGDTQVYDQSFGFEEEVYLDKFAAAVGSGAAFLYRFVEAMAKAGEEAGFPKDQATQMALNVAIGAMKLAEASGQPVSTLRKNITSPGGSTAEGLKVLDKAEIDNTAKKVVEAAFARNLELGS